MKKIILSDIEMKLHNATSLILYKYFIYSDGGTDVDYIFEKMHRYLKSYKIEDASKLLNSLRSDALLLEEIRYIMDNYYDDIPLYSIITSYGNGYHHNLNLHLYENIEKSMIPFKMDIIRNHKLRIMNSSL